MKLLRLSLSLTGKDGFKWKHREYEAEEKKSIFSIKGNVPDNDIIGERRIKKTQLNTPDSIYNITHAFIAYSIWCLPEQEQQAGALLNEKVLTVAMGIKKEAELMFSHL